MTRKSSSIKVKPPTQIPFDVVKKAIKQLANERMQEVLIKRFGLKGNLNPKTLERIGQDLKITRERVRQIENEALKRIDEEKGKTGINQLLERLKELIVQYEGIISEIRIFNEFANRRLDDLEKKSLLLLLRMGKDFNQLNKPHLYEKAWYLKNSRYLDTIKELHKWVKKRLKQENKALSQKQLLEILNENEKLQQVPDSILYTYVDIPKIIDKNIFNKWGLIDWPHIKPKRIKDKIILVFEKYKKPMHYEEIAKKIKDLNFDTKKVCVPTVHNELIKDSRFILTGRGVYALKKWNFYKGTVKEVIKKILIEKQKPLTKEEIIQETLNQRQVKETTVLLNLNDPKSFLRRGEYYFLVEHYNKYDDN
jgi:hypothetical protein